MGHAPENTLAGIRSALELGSDAVEVDLHATADGVPVLLHDDLVDRTTDGHGDVRSLTLEQVRDLDAGARVFHGRFAGERVPTLAEALALVTGQALLVLEIKQRGIEVAVLETVRRFGAANHVMVWSFDSGVVARIRGLAPEIACGLLWSAAGGDLERMWAAMRTAGAGAVCIEHSLVTSAVVERADASGLAVFAWTVDAPDAIARLCALGVDGICSNFPERVQAVNAN